MRGGGGGGGGGAGRGNKEGKSVAMLSFCLLRGLFLTDIM